LVWSFPFRLKDFLSHLNLSVPEQQQGKALCGGKGKRVKDKIVPVLKCHTIKLYQLLN
jgi:hypothetical protein